MDKITSSYNKDVYMRHNYITYSIAKDEKTFWKWPIGKRRSVEVYLYFLFLYLSH